MRLPSTLIVLRVLPKYQNSFDGNTPNCTGSYDIFLRTSTTILQSSYGFTGDDVAPLHPVWPTTIPLYGCTSNVAMLSMNFATFPPPSFSRRTVLPATAWHPVWPTTPNESHLWVVRLPLFFFTKLSEDLEL
jgi:hypothetical protein